MLLTAENLSARRGEDLIFMNVSFKLTSGQALVLTGPNGSGKSTLLRVLAGLFRPETGSVKIAGEGIETGTQASEASHYLGHRNAMKQELSVFENLSFWKDFLGDFNGGASLTIEEAAETVGLSGITHLPFGYLSAGQQRRFAMAKLLVSWRPVWILDEPTAALDASADVMFTGLVKAHLARGGIVVAATHQPLGLETAQELRMTGFAGVEIAW
ncbi:heme ABC exporter ATP-binding protein CcmA [Rhizobium sp. Leaf262]|uniref:heme ABC exporter ATP-binding protein CcmA n=1 Tax=Rhizobium sp. Leaf262 TaxID=1736312 RepID=UPI000713320E|nr:heme ABC exporter ATP-binding protein CcmA [Rhizobium sp. Leaf262]KQO73833.1 cytochrome C biogenesis protein [Rhizobium sp. Leaf262]